MAYIGIEKTRLSTNVHLLAMVNQVAATVIPLSILFGEALQPRQKGGRIGDHLVLPPSCSENFLTPLRIIEEEAELRISLIPSILFTRKPSYCSICKIVLFFTVSKALSKVQLKKYQLFL